MKEFGEVLENVDLKKYNTYRIGGKARYLIKPYNIESLELLINYLNNNNIKYLVIGNGSNIILPDEDYDGVIILLSNLNKCIINKDEVYIEAGEMLNVFVMNIVNNNLGGIENLCGIPGTLGGAIVQNAGCYGTNISDKLISVSYLENGKIFEIKNSECNFSYRDSIFKSNKNKIILSAKFKFDFKNKDEMLSIIKENNQRRKNGQPLEYSNAGSVFRNPINLSSGKLIDEAGLKGYNINDAYISSKHANFIINKGNATSKDIIDLINYIKKVILEKYNIELILEQEIIKY